MNRRTATDTLPLDGGQPRPAGLRATISGTRAGRRAAALPRIRRDLNAPGHREGRLVFGLAGQVPIAPPDALYGGGVDWDRLLAIAWDEGAVAPLQDYCRALPPGTVPLDVERRLACLVLERALRMRVLERRAGESLAVLNDAGIDVALLKGAALAATVYGSFNARPMNDVDILVDPARAEDAKRLMLRAGWSQDHGLPDDEIYASQHHHLAPLVDARGSRSRLEIHRMLFPAGHPFALSLEELWRETRLAQLAGHSARVLDANHHAVHIAVHFAWSHTMRAGAWNAFRDLDALDSAGRIDWAEFVALARRSRAATCCYWTLRLAQTMSGIPVPQDVIDELAPPMNRALLDRLERHFVHVLLRRDPTYLSPRLDRALWTMAMQPSRRGHGAIRPWLVSAELTAARLRDTTASKTGRVRRQLQTAVLCGAYLANILWH